MLIFGSYFSLVYSHKTTGLPLTITLLLVTILTPTPITLLLGVAVNLSDEKGGGWEERAA